MSNKGSTYVKCKFCCDANNDNNDLRVQSCYGKNAHQLSNRHTKKKHKYTQSYNELCKTSDKLNNNEFGAKMNFWQYLNN